MQNFNRRTLLAAAIAAPFAPQIAAALQGTPAAVEVVERVIIDLPSEPVTIHPARAYRDIDWAVVHSIFDALVGFDAEGELRPIAAESFELIDDVTWEVTLRSGLVFHDGSPVTSAAILRGFDLITGSDSLVSDVFGIVESVEEVDDLTARIQVHAPSPWLPAQMASWHVLIPQDFSPEQPIGSGPYVFEHWNVGEDIALRRFTEYQSSATKGTAIAENVTYHFVPEATTRISNVLSGSSDIASFLPIDALGAFDSGEATLRHEQVAGSWFIRIATDTAPFDDARVRRALNLALDLDSFVGVLVHEGSERLASLYPKVGMGFDNNLPAYAYDPEQAQALLAEAGYEDGLDVTLEATADASVLVCEALIGQWAEVGVRVELVLSDAGAFNANWADPAAPVLRMASWSPMFDPSTLLNLAWHSEGVLSRYSNPHADELIDLGGSVFGEERVQAYQELGTLMHDDAAAVFLWSLMHVAAITENAESWAPRPDQWIMALAR